MVAKGARLLDERRHMQRLVVALFPRFQDDEQGAQIRREDITDQACPARLK